MAVDIGGTFTDLVVLDGEGVTGIAKVLTTAQDPTVGVEDGIARVLESIPPQDLREVVHGTTLVANALIERKGSKTALITTRGFRDVLGIGREQRYDLYDLNLELAEPLVPRRLRWEIAERVHADGSVEQAPDPEELAKIARRLEREQIESFAVCLMHSYRYPKHEQAVAELLRDELPDLAVSLSSEVSPELGEFVRTSTTVANAYVAPLISRYLANLYERLRNRGVTAPLYVMLSNGGRSAVETARRFPIALCKSGPAAGVISASFFGGLAGHKDILAFDMGGTTAKACLVEDGDPLVSPDHEVARVYRFIKGSGLPLRVPGIDLIEIGAGGGSIAHVGPFGLPKVGPDSAGADPGPACYDRGGSAATVTDADLLLGYLNPEFFLGGEMALNLDAAQRSVGRLADELGVSNLAAAAAIHRVVNENMAAAARMHAVERGKDLRRFTLVATGGAGPVHAWGLAQALGLRTIVFPPRAGVASAFGLLAAPPAFDFARSLPGSLEQTNWDQVRLVLEAMVEEGARLLAAAGSASAEFDTELSVDIRYRGQGSSLTVPIGRALNNQAPARQIGKAFASAYQELFGRTPEGVDPEVLTWRVRVTGPVASLGTQFGPTVGEGDAFKGSRSVWFAELDDFVDTRVLDRYLLSPGSTVRGPAVLEEQESTVVLGPGATGQVDKTGNITVHVDV